jgi:hypothetical protein
MRKKMTQTRFGDVAKTFKMTKAQLERMPAGDVILLRHLAFYPLAASLLAMFEVAPNLQNVKVVHNFQHEARGEFNTVIEAKHEVWVIAPEAGIDPDEAPEDHETYVRELVPFSLMGKGEFEISRDDVRIQRFLGLHETDQSQFLGLVAELAHKLNFAFGTVRTAHVLG